MTKLQAIKLLVRMGCTDVVPDGKFCVYLTTPSGQRALVDPRDYLLELTLQQMKAEYFQHGKSDKWFELRSIQDAL